MAVNDLDMIAIRRGALGVLMFVAPVYVLVAVLASGNTDSSWWLVLAAALLFGATFGGYAGARDRPPTPITHGALASGLGLVVLFAVALLIQLLRGHLTLASSLTAIVMVQIGVALGCLGGMLAKRAAPR